MQLNERIIAARQEAGLSQEAFAQAVGKTRSAVAKWESGDIRPRQKTILKIAEVTNKSVLWLESGIPEGGGLMVIGKVSAGVWKEGNVNFSSYFAPFSPRSDFPAAAQRLYDVEGTSINKFAREGEQLLAVSVHQAGIQPEDGDMVIVRRMDHGMTEYTAKILTKNGKKWVLRPYSDDPQWQSEIPIADDESAEIEITDIVIGKNQAFGRRGAMR